MSGYSSIDNSGPGTPPLQMGYVPGDAVKGYREGGDARFPRNPPTQRMVVTTATNGQATWTFPSPYPAGTVPVISLAVVAAAGSAPGVKILAVSNTAVTIEATTSAISLGVLSVNALSTAKVHIKADTP